MAILMPQLMAPLKNEAAYLRQHSRAYPRFKLHLALVAILSVALVCTAFHLATAQSRHNLSDILKSSGVVAFSATDVQKFVKEENLTAYWAGPKTDYKYTVVATTPGEVTISYFPKNADIRKAATNILVVQTHHHLSTKEALAYSQEISGRGSFLMNQGATGNAIQYNPASPNRVVVTIENQHDTVTIFNSVPEAALTLAMKPGVVQRVA